MVDIILDLFGEYTPITYAVPDGAGGTYDVVAGGFAGLDWPWLAGVFLFGLTLWSVFRLIGAIFSRRR